MLLKKMTATHSANMKIIQLKIEIYHKFLKTKNIIINNINNIDSNLISSKEVLFLHELFVRHNTL